MPTASTHFEGLLDDYCETLLAECEDFARPRPALEPRASQQGRNIRLHELQLPELLRPAGLEARERAELAGRDPHGGFIRIGLRVFAKTGTRAGHESSVNRETFRLTLQLPRRTADLSAPRPWAPRRWGALFRVASPAGPRRQRAPPAPGR